MEKWTVESAIKWADNHGHKFVTNNKGRVTLVLTNSAGLKALSCGDYLHKAIHIGVKYPKYKIPS